MILLSSYVSLKMCPPPNPGMKTFAGFRTYGVHAELERVKGLAMCLAHSAGEMDVPIIKSDHKSLQ